MHGIIIEYIYYVRDIIFYRVLLSDKERISVFRRMFYVCVFLLSAHIKCVYCYTFPRKCFKTLIKI